MELVERINKDSEIPFALIDTLVLAQKNDQPCASWIILNNTYKQTIKFELDEENDSPL